MFHNSPILAAAQAVAAVNAGEVNNDDAADAIIAAADRTMVEEEPATPEEVAAVVRHFAGVAQGSALTPEQADALRRCADLLDDGSLLPAEPEPVLLEA